jgi:hypothetical protein
MRRGSAVGIEAGYWLDDQGAEVRVPVGSTIFTSSYRPGVHPTSYPMATVCFFSGDKATEA